MSSFRKAVDALTMCGSDGGIDVLLKLAQLAIAGAIFITGCVMLLAAAVP
jgi:hypothetical protein